MRVRLLAEGSIIVLVIVTTWLLTLKPQTKVAQAQSEAHRSTSPPQPYLEYQVYGNSVIIDTTMPPVLSNGRADYTQIYTEHNLCSLIASGQVDEVWIWAGNGDGVTKGHMWEWTTSGPSWYGDAPDCGKVVTTMTFNYLREVDVALHSFNHRLEGFFGHYFTCDFSTATWPWGGSTTWPYNQCGNQLNDRYGFVARPFSGNDQIGGCGDAHHPPNILSNQDYIYDDTTTVETICPSWSQDGSAIPTTLNCQAWGCTPWGFHMWWMQNVPNLNNINKDRNGNSHLNWWSYLFGVPTDDQPPIPTDQFQIYLPLILSQHTGNLFMMEDHSSSLRQIPPSHYATKSIEENYIGVGSKASNFTTLGVPTFVASQPAVTMKTVYVLYYPGYGGTPRADVNVLTTELIGLLKEATVYHGYNYAALRGSFLGQDGQSYAGRGCTTGTVADNVHIRLDGLKSGVQPTSYRVDDLSGGGRWATPCDPVSNWMLYVTSSSPDEADLYFKPFRDAPNGSEYVVSVQYDDGTSESVTVIGSQVHTLVGTFLGQDGQSYAGEGCSTGTVPDNVHIRLDGLKSGVQPTSYRVDDLSGGGRWATPCDPVSNWMLYVTSSSPDEADLYFKPFRNAPYGTIYTILIQYSDQTSQTIEVVGTHIMP